MTPLLLLQFRSEEQESISRSRLRLLLQGSKTLAEKGLTVHTYAQGFDFDNESDAGSLSVLSQSVLSQSMSFIGSPGREYGRRFSHIPSIDEGNITTNTANNATTAISSSNEQKDTYNKLLNNMKIHHTHSYSTSHSRNHSATGEEALLNPIAERTESMESNFATAIVNSKPLYHTLPLLLNRSIMNIMRQPALCMNRIAQGVFFGLILSCFYAPIGQDQNSIQNRIGNLYELTALCFIGMLSCIAIYPTERNVFYREYIDGDYSVLAFFLSYFLIAIPFILVTSIIISGLITYAVGLQPTYDAFLVFSSVLFSFIFTGECIGVIFCTLFIHIGFAVNVMSVVLSIFGKLYVIYIYMCIKCVYSIYTVVCIIYIILLLYYIVTSYNNLFSSTISYLN